MITIRKITAIAVLIASMNISQTFAHPAQRRSSITITNSSNEPVQAKIIIPTPRNPQAPQRTITEALLAIGETKTIEYLRVILFDYKVEIYSSTSTLLKTITLPRSDTHSITYP